MLDIQFYDINFVSYDLLTNLEFSCLLSVIDSLNDLFGYDEMLE